LKGARLVVAVVVIPRPHSKVSDADVLQHLLKRLEFHGETMPLGDLANNLMEMGFQVRQLKQSRVTVSPVDVPFASCGSVTRCCTSQVSHHEAIHLLQQMGLGDDSGEVTKAQFLASQIDWQVRRRLNTLSS
jgi:hypothetical protein